MLAKSRRQLLKERTSRCMLSEKDVPVTMTGMTILIVEVLSNIGGRWIAM